MLLCVVRAQIGAAAAVAAGDPRALSKSSLADAFSWGNVGSEY